MKHRRRDSVTWYVDWAAGGQSKPRVGDVVKRLTATNRNGGWWTVSAVRTVKSRKPLDPPYVSRYRVEATYLGEDSPFGPSWTMYDRPRKPRVNPDQTRQEPDRFSPLL